MKTLDTIRALISLKYVRTGLLLVVLALLAVVVLVNTRAGAAEAPEAITEEVISGVPAYLDRHGSGPTAAGMVIGYWDGNGFGNLIAGDAFTQTDEVNAAIASEENYTDYCLPRDDDGEILRDKSEDPPFMRHEDNCLADYMKTSQSAYANWYGYSAFMDVGPALQAYVLQTLGPGYVVETTNLREPEFGGTMNWDNLRAEIDAGRPLILLVDKTGAKERVFVTAVGYRTVDQTQEYACYNTLDQNLHWYEFALWTQTWTQQWAVSSGVTFRIQPLDNGVFLPLVMRSSDS